jgi:transketolase
MAASPLGHNRLVPDKAHAIRRTALQMGAVQGQGYIAQALDVATFWRSPTSMP